MLLQFYLKNKNKSYTDLSHGWTFLFTVMFTLVKSNL